MKKIIVNICTITALVLSCICLGIFFDNCISNWQTYYAHKNSELQVQEFIDGFYQLSVESTCMLIMFFIIAVLNVIMFILFNKNDIELFNFSITKYFSEHKSNKAKTAKQKRIIKLQSELDELKKGE